MAEYQLHPFLEKKSRACNLAIDIVNVDIDRLMLREQVTLYSEASGQEIGQAVLHSFQKNAVCIRCTTVNGCQSCIYQLRPTLQ